jgi:Domain of unknown function (DUF4390)
MRLKILRFLALWLFSLPLLCLSIPGEAAMAKITDIIITQSSANLLVYATLRDAFTKEIEEGIVNGVATSFTFYLRLMKQRSVWTDEEVVSLTVKQTVAYDLLKDEFSFTSQNGNQTQTLTTKNFAYIRRWMSSLEGVKLTSYQNLKPGTLYYVQVRAEIRSIKLVFPLNVLLFFVSFWDFDTPWANSALFRVGK